MGAHIDISDPQVPWVDPETGLLPVQIYVFSPCMHLVKMLTDDECIRIQ